MAQAVFDHSAARSAPHPIPRLGCGLSSQRRSDPQPSLADDCSLFRRDPAGYDDPDREAFTWPEMIDQRWIDQPGRGRFACDDIEMDDGV
jgi:hypothetical protein